MPDQHHITGELCSSSVTIHCIQSDRVTLLPMHTSRTQAAPPCAVWETPPKRALPVHQKGGRRPQMVEQGAGPCEQDTSQGPAFCTMLWGLLALLHSRAPAPAPAAARKSAGSLTRHQRGRPRRRRRSGGAPSRRELAPSPLGPVQGPSPPACSAPAVRTGRLLKQGGQPPPPLPIPGAGREARATARTSRKKEKAKRGPGENQPAGRKQARTCTRQRERGGARRTAGRWRTRPPPVPAAPR